MCAFSPATFQLAISDRAVRLLVAEEANQLIAYSKCAVTTPPPSVTLGRVIELVNLYVYPAHQGRGIGAMLLQQSLQQAILESFAALWLCVWQENRAALLAKSGQTCKQPPPAIPPEIDKKRQRHH